VFVCRAGAERFDVLTPSGSTVAWLQRSGDGERMRVHATGSAPWTISQVGAPWVFVAESVGSRRRTASFQPGRIRAGGRLELDGSGRVFRLTRRGRTWRLADEQHSLTASFRHARPGVLEFELSDAFELTAESRLALGFALWMAYEWDAIPFIGPTTPC
jgi:hypothetical protein